MSELDARYVKRGFWVNRSKGAIMGQTITTDTETGAIVIAILAVCTTLGMSHLWKILLFLWHQAGADGQPSEGLFRQQQALFRTLPPPSTLVTDSFKLGFAWRRKAGRRVLIRTLSIGLLALIFGLGSLAASIFSSSAVAGSGVEVLVSSPFCGLGLKGSATTARLSEQYADACYMDEGTTMPSACNIFIRSRTPFSVQDAQCPFPSKNMCLTDAKEFDTGFMSLNDAFGLNLAQNEDLKLRQKLVCAVLMPENLTSTVNATQLPLSLLSGFEPLPGEKVLVINLGERPGGVEWANFTMGLNINLNERTAGFGHSTVSILPNDGQSFIFKPELKIPDAATYIHVIRKGGYTAYTTPVDDPVFAAHRESNITATTNTDSYTMTTYRRDEPVSFIGCAAQYQLCMANTPSSSGCTKLQSLPFEFTEALPEINGTQYTLMQVLQNALIEFSYASLQRLKIDSLSVNDIIGSLPNDQWVKELERWVAVGLSHLQIGLSDYAIGLAVRDPTTAQEYDMPPTAEGQKRLCTMQKMRKPGGFTNINFFALVFMITFSVTVTLLDLVLLRFLIFMSRFRAALFPRIDRWIQDGIFQLQRRAYESQAQWQDTEEEIPVTTGNELLPDLPSKMMPPESLLSTSSTPTSPQKINIVASWPTPASTEVASARVSINSRSSGDSAHTGPRPTTPTRAIAGDGFFHSSIV